jgi:hypothetical protein
VSSSVANVGLTCAEESAHSSMLVTGGKPEGIVLSRVSSSVANVGLARAEESADSFSLVTGGKPEGILLSRVSSSVAHVGPASAEESADSSPSVTDISSLLATGGKSEGIVLSRVSESSSVACVGGTLAASGGFTGVEDHSLESFTACGGASSELFVCCWLCVFPPAGRTLPYVYEYILLIVTTMPVMVPFNTFKAFTLPLAN